MKIVKSILFQDRLTETMNEGTPAESVIELIPEKRVIIYYIDDQEILPPNEKDFTMLSKLVKLSDMSLGNPESADLTKIGSQDLLVQLLDNIQKIV
jgi:hypothetical protein